MTLFVHVGENLPAGCRERIMSSLLYPTHLPSVLSNRLIRFDHIIERCEPPDTDCGDGDILYPSDLSIIKM